MENKKSKKYQYRKEQKNKFMTISEHFHILLLQIIIKEETQRKNNWNFSVEFD